MVRDNGNGEDGEHEAAEVDVTNPQQDSIMHSTRHCSNNVINIASDSHNTFVTADNFNQYMLYPVSTSSTSGQSGSNVVHADRCHSESAAIDRVIEIQKRISEDDLELQGLPGVVCQDVPRVHPRFVKVFFFEGEAAQPDEYSPEDRGNLNLDYAEDVPFDNLLDEGNSDKSFLALIGYPGSGKTTCSKRLARYSQRATESDTLVCFRLSFMHLNHGDRKLTLRELLLDNSYPDLDAETCRLAFSWVLNHQRKCVIIMDGYDQAEWNLNRSPPHCRYDVQLHVRDIVSNLCSGHFLKLTRLIITSRPHRVITMPITMRPQLTLMLKDLTFEDMKKLFFAYAQDEAEALWQKLYSTAPQLLSFCLNPMMLQFCVRASLRPSGQVGRITTVTRIFATVLENLRRSDGVRGIDDIATIIKQLGTLAFDATQLGTVLITIKQLREQGLSIEEVQDVVIAVCGHLGFTCKVFDGDTKLYFSHQSLQEYFTALHLVKQLTISQFNDVMERKLFTPQWSMVRKFVCGLLVDMSTEGCDVSAKRESFISKLKERIVEFRNGASREVLLDAWIDLRECNDDMLLAEAAQFCPDVVDFSTRPLTASQAHAVSSLLCKVSGNLKRLDLYSCSMDDYSFKLICNAITRMPGSIDVLSMVGNNLSQAALPSLCQSFSKINDAIIMWDAFDSNRRYRDAENDEVTKLQDELDRCDSQRLKIKVAPGRILEKR